MSVDQPPAQEIRESGVISDACHGLRLDQAVSKMFPQFSRARLQQWIKEGSLTLDGVHTKTKQKVLGGEQVEINAQCVVEGDWVARELDLDIVFEDDEILVLNKPVDCVVHPAVGHWDDTLLNGLLYRLPALRMLPRAGIVHRLDKDTSGLMVVAKTLQAHNSLVKQLKAKTVLREYIAVVEGIVKVSGTIDKPIGRHPTHRIKMAVVSSGKPAVTHYKVLQHFPAHTLLQLNLETGRTHQIRVHVASLQFPILGDPLYGGRQHLPKKASEKLLNWIQQYSKQALHARKLSFVHPANGKQVTFEAAPSADMAHLIQLLSSPDSYIE